MNKKQKLLKDIDRSIDSMDLNSVNNGLDALLHMENQTIEAEDYKEFAAKIINKNMEVKSNMKHKKIIQIAIVAAIVCTMGITAFASNVLNMFTFVKDGKLVNIVTDQEMTEAEAEKLASEIDFIPGVNSVESEDLTFNTIEEAEAKMEINLIIPSGMPEMKLASAKGQTFNYPNAKNDYIWLDYEDNNGRMFGITTTRETLFDSNIAVSKITSTDIDEGSLGSYVNKDGIEFTTLTESDDTGERTAHIATTKINNYEYSLVFFGFEEKERQAIIDSVDLSTYSK